MCNDQQLPTITHQALHEPVQRLFESSTVAVLIWECITLHPGTHGMHGGVYQVSGHARDRGTTRSWSLVLKIVRPPEAHLLAERNVLQIPDTGTDPTSVLYWKREALLAQAG